MWARAEPRAGHDHHLDVVGLGEFRGDLRSKPGPVDESGEVDVVHDDLGTVVRSMTRGEEVSHAQLRDRAVEERTFVKRIGHPESF